jgi:hypothetical protein
MTMRALPLILILIVLDSAKSRANEEDKVPKEWVGVVKQMMATLEANQAANEWLSKGHDADRIKSAIEVQCKADDWSFGSWNGPVLPKKAWPPLIQKLAPLELFRDGVHVVIAMARTNEIEKGFYIKLPLSSSMTVGPKEGWVFKQVGGDIWSYEREFKRRKVKSTKVD